MDITVEELRDLQKQTLEDPLPLEEAAEQWLSWFKKRAERILKSAAAFGHSYTTLDLPIELSSELSKPIHKSLLQDVKKLLPGCKTAIVEEEYEGKVWYKLEVSWAT
jgi:hypothetical protein